MEKALNKFIENNINRKGFKDYLKESQSIVLKNYYKIYDPDTYYTLLDKEKEQTTLHKFMEKECNDLFAFCKNNNIKIIGLKGLFLEKQFWNQTRFYNDIDLIIDPKDINKLYGFFSNGNTYRIVKKRNINPFVKNPALFKMQKIDLHKIHHIVLWKENEELLSNKIEHIEIEIHGAFDTFKIVDINDEIMMNDSIEFMNFNVLSPESQILFLIYHVIHHLPYIRHDLSKMYVKIDRFVDIALVIENSEINWKKFLEICKTHSMSPLCAFFFKMFNEIFPELIPQRIITEIDFIAEDSDFYWKNIYYRLMKMNPIDLIIGDFHSFPEIDISFKKMQKIMEGRFNNHYLRKIVMETWKVKLKKINSKLIP